jgi:acetyltransferase-like isoleucine patch superfamily enzyme
LFECRNQGNHKIITILGIKIKFNRTKKRTIKIPLLEKFLLYDKNKGYNNKIQTLVNGKWLNIYTKHYNSKFRINGNNNIIHFHFKTKSLPKGLDITINGSNNVIDIYKTSFNNTYIQIYRDSNTLCIKEQTIQSIANAHIYVSYGGSMFIGKDCELGNGGLELAVAGDYIKKHKMVIGDNTHIAKDTIIRTSDGQSLIDPITNLPTDPPEDVIIGNHVWIMSRCIILKGSYIPNGCAVAANSLVNKKFNEENLLICGCPAKIMKHNIRWGEPYGKYMETLRR